MPLTVDTAKLHLNVEHDLDNEYIEVLLKGSVKAAQQYCWRYFTETDIEIKFYAQDCIEFPYPVNSISTAKFIDDESNETNLVVGTHYEVITENDVSILKKLEDWPSSTIKRLEFTFKTGTTPDEDVIIAILLMITHNYENRINTVSKMPTAAQRLLDPHRRIQFR